MDNHGRKFERLTFISEAKLSNGKKSEAISIIDLSLKGVHFGKPDKIKLSINQELSLAIIIGELDASKSITMTVKIDRQTPEGYACHWLEIDENSFHHLHKLLTLNFGDAKLIDREIKDLIGLE